MSDSLIGKTFKSNNYGDFKVLSYIGKNYYRIKFIATGYEKECVSWHIKKGVVMDNSLARIPVPERNKLTGKTFTIPHKGDVLVLDRVESNDLIIRYKVRFLNTGEEGVYRKQHILRGNIGNIGSKILYINKVLYDRYKIISLSKNNKYLDMRTYKLYDKVLNNTFEMSGLMINSKLHKLKWIEVTDLEGNKEYIYNCADFAKKIGGTRQGIHQILNKERTSYKGYKFEYVD